MKREWMKNMKIGKKLLTSFLAIVVLYVLTVSAALWGIHQIWQSMDTFYQHSYQSTSSAQGMRAAIQGIGRDILSISSAVYIQDEQAYLEEAKEYAELIDSGVKNLQRTFSNEEVLNQAIASLEAVVPVRDKLLNLLADGKKDEAIVLYGKEYEPLAKTARTALKAVEDYAKESAAKYWENSRASTYRTTGLMVALALLVVAATTLLWYTLTRMITKPIRELKAASKEMENGNLEVDISYESQDELGDLADSLRKTAATLKQYTSAVTEGMLALGSGKLTYRYRGEFKGDFRILGESLERISSLLGSAIEQIASSADQVASGADQVASGAQVLSQGAVEQASSVEELAASINEISAGVRANADDAVNASKKADGVGVRVGESDEQMEHMNVIIGRIKTDSNRITEIVREIEDIAFQTNILALNAAVEAARAGDAGRGFAVVASEVRHLASKTTEASKMTTELAMETTRTVDEGAQAAARTTESLKKVVEGVRDMNAMLERISDASIHQADSIIQIRRSIELISKIVQGNSATSEESAAASEELSAQAQLLKKLVEEFER